MSVGVNRRFDRVENSGIIELSRKGGERGESLVWILDKPRYRGGEIDVATGQAINTIEKLFGKTGQARRVANVWITIPEVVIILGKKTHQIRPLIWDGELGESRKEGRKVVVRKNAVLAYKKTHPGTNHTTVAPSDMAREVLSACELVSKLFVANTAAVGGKEFVAKVQVGLDRFANDARSLVS